jgi:hypothetical protein
MGKFFTIGGVAGWLLVSVLAGRLQPAFSLKTFLAVLIGGLLGVVVGAALTSKKNDGKQAP